MIKETPGKEKGKIDDINQEVQGEHGEGNKINTTDVHP